MKQNFLLIWKSRNTIFQLDEPRFSSKVNFKDYWNLVVLNVMKSEVESLLKLLTCTGVANQVDNGVLFVGLCFHWVHFEASVDRILVVLLVFLFETVGIVNDAAEGSRKGTVVLDF